MRISGGTLSGRQLVAPAGDATRPTSDKVRQAIFNRLVHAKLAGADELYPLAGPVLDLFAGSGGLGLEALSRGASRCDFVDGSAPACECIEKNLASLGLGARAKVHRSRVDAFLERAEPGYTLLFADPPYADAGALLDKTLDQLLARDLLIEGALCILEHAVKPAPRVVTEPVDGLELLDQREYGQTVVSFVRVTRRGTRSPP
ncbi:MAG: 16S rRNA (guanine(966)-N(2))-methyltransferase RsmD [Polyangia bacterium]